MTDSLEPDQKTAEDKPGVVERRAATSDRRQRLDRRRGGERRHDTRLAPVNRPSQLKLWFHSLVHPRLGVDRRKNTERRRNYDRRQHHPSVLLTPEELADLLS